MSHRISLRVSAELLAKIDAAITRGEANSRAGLVMELIEQHFSPAAKRPPGSVQDGGHLVAILASILERLERLERRQQPTLPPATSQPLQVEAVLAEREPELAGGQVDATRPPVVDATRPPDGRQQLSNEAVARARACGLSPDEVAEAFPWLR